jgi:hypothetical protein
MSEADVFSSAEAPTAAEALDAALRTAGLGRRALAELVWLGSEPEDLPGDFPLLTLAENSTHAHLILQFVLRRLLAGERGLFALGQSWTDHAHAVCLILGGPAVVGRLNLLPVYRLYPASPLPADPDDAAEAFRISLAPPLQLEEPTPEDAPPQIQIISPAAPPPPPPEMPEPPQINLLLAEGGDPPLYPDARRIPPSSGLPAVLGLLAGLSADEPWGGLVTPLARGYLLTMAEKL